MEKLQKSCCDNWRVETIESNWILYIDIDIHRTNFQIATIQNTFPT